MRYQTTSGQFVSAATKAEAAALAAQYGFGEIAGAAPATAKAPVKLRAIGVWDDLTQSWEVGPSEDYAAIAAELAEDDESYGALVAVQRTADGWRLASLTAAEKAALRRAAK